MNGKKWLVAVLCVLAILASITSASTLINRTEIEVKIEKPPSPLATPSVTPYLNFTVYPPVYVPPNESTTSKIKPLKLVYFVDVDTRSKELIINITLENIGTEVIRDVHVEMETPPILYRVAVFNAIEEPEGLFIGDLEVGASKTLTQRYKLVGKTKGDLEIPVIVKASGSDLYTILVIIIVIAEALLRLLTAGLIPGFEAIMVVVSLIIVVLILRRRR